MDVGTYGPTDVPTEGRTFPPLMLLGRLGGVDLTEADKPTIRLGATPPGLTSAHLHRAPIF